MEKIVLFGGSFDPFHNGHKFMIEEVAKLSKYTKLIIIPTYQSPHKSSPLLTGEERADLIKTCLPILPMSLKIEISKLEYQKKEPSWTINTIAYYKKKYPNATFSLLIGSDNYKTFKTWKSYKDILSTVELIIIRREESESKKLEDISQKLKQEVPQSNISLLTTSVYPISSTQIRQNSDLNDMHIPQIIRKKIEEIYKK